MDDLLKDETFLARWLEGELSEAELTKFRQHPDFDFYQRMKGTTEEMSVEAIDTDKLFDNIQQSKLKKSKTQQKRPNLSRRLFIYSAAAAAAIFLIGYFVFLKPDIQEIKTLADQQINHTLPDGSRVFLSPNSKLVYAANTFKKNRQVQLNGQAFFEVQKGESFLVETKKGNVEVLGTSFSVFSDAQKFIVACKTGRVKVSDKTGKQQVLNKGERVRSKALKLQEKELIDPLSIGNWQDTISRFESEKLSVVTQAIENQFGIQIRIPNTMKDEKFTGSFLHKDIDTAMKMVFLPMGMEFEKKEERVYEVSVKNE